LFEELARVAHLELEVVTLDVGTELDLLDHGLVLSLLGLGFPLRLLVAVLAIVHDATDGRPRVRRDLHQVLVHLPRSPQRIGDGHDPQLSSIRSNDTHHRGADPIVDPHLVLRRNRESSSAPPAHQREKRPEDRFSKTGNRPCPPRRQARSFTVGPGLAPNGPPGEKRTSAYS